MLKQCGLLIKLEPVAVGTTRDTKTDRQLEVEAEKEENGAKAPLCLQHILIQ